jgi:ankyrin repeat protein
MGEQTAPHEAAIQAILAMFGAGKRASYISFNYVNDGLTYRFYPDQEDRLKELAIEAYPAANAVPASGLQKWLSRLFGAKPQPFEGKTPLMYAARTLNVTAMEILADAGADLDAQDENGVTAAMSAVYAASIGYINNALEKPIVFALPEAIQFFIDRNANLNIKAKGGETLLMMLCYDYNHGKAADAALKLLLASGKVDLYARRDDGKTAFDIAESMGNEQALKRLKEAASDKVRKAAVTAELGLRAA